MQSAKGWKRPPRRTQARAIRPPTAVLVQKICLHQSTQRGCKHGQYCNFIHTSEKWRVCHQWATTKCRYGQDCPLAHSGRAADPADQVEGEIQQGWATRQRDIAGYVVQPQSMAPEASSVPTPEVPEEPTQAESAENPQTTLAKLEADLQESLKQGATNLEKACELESRADNNDLQPTKLEAAPSNSPEEESQPSLKPLGEKERICRHHRKNTWLGKHSH
jgi:hypothetical protein